jgi:hypothetical protein
MFGLVSDYGDLIAADYGYNRSLLIVMPFNSNWFETEEGSEASISSNKVAARFLARYVTAGATSSLNRLKSILMQSVL